MTAAHTAGPWSHGPVKREPAMVYAPDGIEVARVYDLRDRNLVCAAPDLLAALKDLEQSVRDLSEQSDENALDYLRLLRRGHGMFTRMEAARAALRQAEGAV